MPTDPFVSPDLTDRPRQQQNLPPGIAYPPPARGAAARPAELAVGQPHGRMLGDPGPNVGYAYTLAERARKRLRLAAGEHADDALSVVAEIAGRRAASFGRAPVIGDIDHAISLLGYEEQDREWSETRAHLAHGAAHHYPQRRALVGSVPESALRARVLERAAIEAWRTGVASAH